MTKDELLTIPSGEILETLDKAKVRIVIPRSKRECDVCNRIVKDEKVIRTENMSNRIMFVECIECYLERIMAVVQ